MQGQYYDGAMYGSSVDEAAVNRFVAKVFGWMFIGLMVTCLSTVAIIFGINVSEAFASFIVSMSRLVFIIFIVEVILVGVISARVAKMNPATAVMLYLLYAVLNGFTVGLFALLYAGNMSTLGLALGITGVSFGVMAVYGLVTKSDLTKAGNLLRTGLIGLIILSVVNLFLGNGMLDMVICAAGLFIFLGLTAYDTKKIKTYYAQAAMDPSAVAGNFAIVGALMLYLDFINMFLFILRLLNGGRK